MIGQSGRGVLSDWDHALKVILRNTPKAYRAGTGQFIYMLLLQYPMKGHDVQDDLESSFWVLLYVSLHYFPHNLGSAFHAGFFDECMEQSGLHVGDGKIHLLEGSRKPCDAMSCNSKKTCAPLNKLIHAVGKLFNKYQSCYTSRDDDGEDAEARFRATQEKLEQVDVVLNHFDTTLECDEWPENDVLPDQFPSKTRRQEDHVIHDLSSRAVATAALERQAAVSQRTLPTLISVIPGALYSARLVRQGSGQQDLASEAGPFTPSHELSQRCEENT
ncbi:unnamed protein product [Somion occarium]|uniref:Fungal-type protein kinase domain-containing protein n=1 Tax=Somion occarium TaxID=3059160 RepID=A0ABP1DMC1_9APHY